MAGGRELVPGVCLPLRPGRVPRPGSMQGSPEANIMPLEVSREAGMRLLLPLHARKPV